jgi:phosphotransferase system IIB component
MHARPARSRFSALLRALTGAALLVLGLVAVPSLHAQRGDPAARLQQKVELYTTRLKLTPAQVEKVKQILTKQSQDMQALFQSANGDFSSIREKMAPMREETDKKIVAVLTSDEQKQAFAALQKEQAERRANMQRGQ